MMFIFHHAFRPPLRGIFNNVAVVIIWQPCSLGTRQLIDICKHNLTSPSPGAHCGAGINTIPPTRACNMSGAIDLEDSRGWDMKSGL